MNTVPRCLLALTLLAATTGVALAQEANTITGKVTSITVDDLTHTRGVSSAERRYAVRVELSTSPQGTVLGFAESSKQLAEHKGMFDLLTEAMENDWTVTLRLRRDSGSSGRSHARVTAVTVRR